MKKEIIVLVLLVLMLACAPTKVSKAEPTVGPEYVPVVAPQQSEAIGQRTIQRPVIEAPVDQQIMDASDDLPNAPSILATGNFEARVHQGAGQVKIIEENGKQFLKFENFQSDSGPDLRIYLSVGDDVSTSLDLGPIKGLKGDFVYEIPKGANLEKYDKVLVWCKAFGVLFSIANLEY